MRIISKFVDYYDSAQGFGIDPDLIYKRKIREEEKIEATADIVKLYFSIPNGGTGFHSVITHRVIVGFCGRLYPMVLIRPWNANGKDYVVHDADDHAALIKTFGDDSNLEVFEKAMQVQGRHGNGRMYWYRPTNRSDYADMKVIEHERLFRELDTPVFVIKGVTDNWFRAMDHKHRTFMKVEVNPNLRQYDFFRFKDPFTAFQEISMYLGGVLGTAEKEIITISDESMRDKKGFDDMSFKKEPGKKRRRKG